MGHTDGINGVSLDREEMWLEKEWEGSGDSNDGRPRKAIPRF